MLIGIDRFMSEGRAIINFIGNTVATIVIAKSENAIDMDRYRFIVESKTMPFIVDVDMKDKIAIFN